MGDGYIDVDCNQYGKLSGDEVVVLKAILASVDAWLDGRVK
jgi:hypothetical protein